MLIKHSGSSSLKCLACFTNSGGNFFVRYASLEIILPRYLKLSMFFRRMVMGMVGSCGWYLVLVDTKRPFY